MQIGTNKNEKEKNNLIQKTIIKIEIDAEKEREQKAKQDNAKANKTKS